MTPRDTIARELLDAIQLILPLAKGYAPAGQTDTAKRTCRSWIEAAEEAVAKADAILALPSLAPVEGEALAAARGRVARYLAGLSQMRGIDHEDIHALHTGDAREAILKASDLTAILSALSPQAGEEGISQANLCRLSRVFNAGCDLRSSEDMAINEWLKRAISAARQGEMSQ